MPLVNYSCESCGLVDEKLVRGRQKPEEVDCSCGAKAKRKEVDSFAADLRGKGFKVTDHPTIDRAVGADAERKWKKYEEKYLGLKKLSEDNPGKEVVRGEDGKFRLAE